jgi:hypothetical protein
MREKRYPVNFAVHLTWQENQGATRRVAGRCLDLSAEGMRIELRDHLAAGATVLLESSEFGRMGHALVRYCRREKMQYRAGLRFVTAFQLSEPARQRVLDSVLIAVKPGANKPAGTGLNSDLLP